MSSLVQSSLQLEKYFVKKDLDRKVLNSKIDHKFTFKAPQFYLDKIDWQNPEDPLKKMIWPDAQEADIRDYQLQDPIGDEAHLAAPNLVHRYPDRVLFLLTNNCQINCRFCFRREVEIHARLPQIEPVVAYLLQHPEVRELIFSGGDPFSLSARYLTTVYEQLRHIPHLKVIRFHTRIPVVNPTALTPDYLALLEKIAENHQLVIAFHINHPQEFSPELTTLARQLKQLGAVLLSQTVLLKSVNDQVPTLVKLFNGLMDIGVKPYYLHHPDLVKGTHHFRLSIEVGRELYLELRRHLSGICQVEYVLDLPGGKGKVPVTSLQPTDQAKTYRAINFKGETIIYHDPV